MQGTGRRERARRWVKAMNRAHTAAGAAVRTGPVGLTELRGLTHDFTKAHEHHDLANLIARAIGLLPEPVASLD
jgi:hypothetical protein